MFSEPLWENGWRYLKKNKLFWNWWIVGIYHVQFNKIWKQCRFCCLLYLALYSVLDMALCSNHSIFILWNSHTIFDKWYTCKRHISMLCFIVLQWLPASKNLVSVSPWDNVSHTHSWPLYDHDIDLWSHCKNYIFTMNLCLGKIIFALWHRHSIGVGVSTCHNTLCTFMTWPICGWPGYP